MFYKSGIHHDYYLPDRYCPNTILGSKKAARSMKIDTPMDDTKSKCQHHEKVMIGEHKKIQKFIFYCVFDINVYGRKIRTKEFGSRI